MMIGDISIDWRAIVFLLMTVFWFQLLRYLDP